MLRIELHDFMRRTIVGFTILIIICAGVRSAMAGDKIDIPKVITKSDAEKILGVPVKDAKGRNQSGKGGYYDSEWSYHAIEGGKEAAEQIGQALANKWSLATALALLVWYIFAPQCASTLAVIKRETGSWKWMAVTFGYMLTLAYAASLATYNIAVALGAG